ncbi:MAG: MCE family protein [Alphaproteobacteria bacterium]|nr:MAG: MCE family protein [Alphaproteobacteria bacterium]
METKAHYVLIGSFVLLVFVAMLGFIMWIVKVDIDREETEYDIYFQESVAGLGVGGIVRYHGVAVGQVKAIRIDPDQPNRVKVTVSVDSTTPVREDAVASLESQGFTGVAYILIEGGSPDAKPLRPKPGEERAVIPSRPSALAELFTDVPTLIAEASLTLSQIRELLSQENRDYVTQILRDVSTVTGSVAGQQEDIRHIVTNLNEALVDYRRLAASLNSLSRAMEGAVDNEFRQALTDISETANAIEGLARNLDGMVIEAREPVNAFTNNTLPQIATMVSETRRLAAALARIAERIERNPGEFLFESRQPEYQAQ